MINTESLSCGPTPKFFGVIGMYYHNADSIRYNSYADLFHSNYNKIDSLVFFDLYGKMLKIGINEVRRNKNCPELSEFLFHSSGMSGERGIVQISDKCNKNDTTHTLLFEEKLTDDFIYVHRSGWQPF